MKNTFHIERTETRPVSGITRTFEDWLKVVDAIIATKMYGLTSSDLPDYCYRDAYDDKLSPASVARSAIRAANEF